MDAHVHAQRWSPGLLRRGIPFNYRNLEREIVEQTPWDNSRALLQDMDRLGISMAVLNIAFNQRNEMIQAQVQRHPDRFIGFTGPVDVQREAYLGTRAYDATRAAAECDYWLSQPEFRGIGEMVSAFPDPDLDLPNEENVRKLYPLMEVAHHHDAPILIHSGCISYPRMCRLEACDPVWVDRLAVRFPDVKIIVGHMGTNSSLTGDLPDRARQVASRHEHVYLETCQASWDQIERAYLDPQIGPEKLVWGTDWGASIPYHRVDGLEPHVHRGQGKVYAGTPFHQPPRKLILHQDWALRQMRRIEMPEEHRAMILGLNMATLCGINVEARLKEDQERRYGPPIKAEHLHNDWEAARTSWERAQPRAG
jgi:predicted TIM-barrel fold metal-dependent hydrolase